VSKFAPWLNPAPPKTAEPPKPTAIQLAAPTAIEVSPEVPTITIRPVDPLPPPGMLKPAKKPPGFYQSGRNMGRPISDVKEDRPWKPAGREHDWGPWEQFVNTPSRSCRVCGVYQEGRNTYKDVHGRTIWSTEALACPTFIGDVNGAIAETKEKVRGILDSMETIEQRVTRLEAENVELKAQIDAKTIDMTAFVRWLAEQVQAQMSQQQQVHVLPDPIRKLLPEPILRTFDRDVIDVEAVPVLVAVEEPES
jgi:hypothetical protein